MADLARIKENVAKMASMNAPEADIDGYIASEGASLDDVRNFQLPAQDTFSSRLQADFQKRKGIMNPIAQIGESQIGQAVGGVIDETGNIIKNIPNQNPTSSGLQLIGQGAKIIGTPVGVAIGALTPDIAKQGAQITASGIDSVAPYIGDSLLKVKELMQANPELSADLSAAANIAGTLYGGKKATEAAPDVAHLASKGIAKGADKAADAVEKLAIPKQVLPNSEQLAEMGVKAYDAARVSGEVFDSGVSGNFLSAIEKAKPAKIAGTVETDLSQALESSLGKYRNIAGKPLSIDEIDIIDKDLSNLKDQAYNAGKNQLGGELANIQNSLRGSVADAPSGQALANARDLYRRKYQMEDVERIFRNAEGRPNEAAIIQTGYRNLANQARKKGSGYTKEQIAIMDKAAKGGLSIDALKLASSKLIPMFAGAAGGFGAGAAAYMGNIAAGAGATALQTAKANKLAKSIVGGLRVEGEPTLVNKAAAKLTKKDLQDALEAKKAKGGQ